MTDLTNALFARLTAAWLSLRDDEEGQGMVEYALIIVLIAIACVLALTDLGGKIGAVLNSIGSSLNVT